MDNESDQASRLPEATEDQDVLAGIDFRFSNSQSPDLKLTEYL